MRLRRISVLLLILLLVFTACAKSGSAAVSAEKGVTVVDCAKRTVTVPEKTDRIACLYAYAGHVCVLLGCEDRIVAVVNGLKRDELMQRKVPDIDDIPAPYSSGSVNIEELAAAKPDLVLLRTENLADAGEQEKLNAIGIPYIVIDYVTMEDQIYSIGLMGTALGKAERAGAYISYYRDTIARVLDRLSDIPEEQRFRVYHSVNEVVRTDIPATLSYEVLEAAGCRNVVGSAEELRLDGNKGMTTVEQIYVWDPDIILATEPDAAEYFRTNEKFTGLRAVREGRVFQLPVGISRWAHPGSVESPLAALYIAQLLYPDRFTDIDMEQEILSFYERFFSIALTEEDLAAILSGQGMRSPKTGGNRE